MSDYFNEDFARYVTDELGEEFLPLLVSRGIDTKQKAIEFLHPELKYLTNPALFSNIDDVARRINQAIFNKEKIVIYGDYDCDGICATYILSDFIRSRGGDVTFYIPDRFSDGYGLSYQAIDRIAETYFPDLIVTVDCGITSVDEVEYIKDLGIDVVITDHHELPQKIPDCTILNSKIDKDKLFGYHCGAGIVFMLVTYMSDIMTAVDYIDVAAVATIGDIVPLVADNRIIAHYGLRKINSKVCNLGIKLLFSDNKNDKVTASDVSFKLVPRINSFGRLGDASRALQFFFSKDNFVLSGIIDEMNKVNAERQELCNDLVADVEEKMKNFDFSTSYSICKCDKRWNSGILGIAAAHVVETYNRPTVLFTSAEDGLLKGSGRSTDKIDLYDALSACSEYAVKFGGHKQAAGISIKESDFEAFSNKFNEYIKNKYTFEDLLPDNSFDAVIGSDEIDFEFVRKLNAFEPCGVGNRRPRFSVDLPKCSAELFKRATSGFRVGIADNVKANVFKPQESFALYALNELKKSFVCEFRLSYFNGNVNAEAKIDDEKFVIDGKVDVLEKYSYFSNVANNCVNDYMVTNIADVMKDLNGFGTLFVAYRYDTYEKIKEIAAKSGKKLMDHVGNIDVNPYDAVVYAPLGKLGIGNYSHVVICDGKELNFEGNAEISCTGGRIDEDIFKNIDVSYQSMAETFKKLKSDCTAANCNCFKLAGKDDMKIFALYVFAELGIFDTSGFVTETGAKNKLENSKLYRLAHSELR